MPLYLGAHALWQGLDPTDPLVHEALWQEVGRGRRPGEFFNPYPATAATLAMPLAYIPLDRLRPILWHASLVSLALGGGVVVLLGRFRAGPGRASAAVAAAGLAVVALTGLEVVPHAFSLGQVNPVVVGLMMVAAVLLARGWGVPAGLFIGLGICLKLLPALLLLPVVLFRRWGALVSTALTVAVVAAITLYWFPGWSLSADLGRALEQAIIGQAVEDPPLWGLWPLRGLVAGVLVLGVAGWLVRRGASRRTLLASVGLTVALGAIQTGGMSPPHEVMLAAPAIAMLAAWLALEGWRPWTVSLAAIAVGVVHSPLDHYPATLRYSQDHALPLIIGLLVLSCALAPWVVRLDAREPA